MDIEESSGNIFFSSVRPWDLNPSQKLTWSASGEMSNLVCYQVDVLSLVLDGWKISMNLQGLWYTRDPIPTGYWLKIFSWIPTVHVKMVRTFHVTEYAEPEPGSSDDYAYKYQRQDGRVEFDRSTALADKAVPTLPCLKCARLNIYGTSSCVSCDACTTIGCDYIDASWLPPMCSDIEGVSDEYKGKLQRQAGPASWSCSHYGWMAYPYSYNTSDMIGRAWHHQTDNNRDDSVGERLSIWIRDSTLR